jgi:hypothetical protein
VGRNTVLDSQHHGSIEEHKQKRKKEKTMMTKTQIWVFVLIILITLFAGTAALLITWEALCKSIVTIGFGLLFAWLLNPKKTKSK